MDVKERIRASSFHIFSLTEHTTSLCFPYSNAKKQNVPDVILQLGISFLLFTYCHPYLLCGISFFLDNPSRFGYTKKAVPLQGPVQ